MLVSWKAINNCVDSFYNIEINQCKSSDEIMMFKKFTRRLKGFLADKELEYINAELNEIFADMQNQTEQSSN